MNIIRRDLPVRLRGYPSTVYLNFLFLPDCAMQFLLLWRLQNRSPRQRISGHKKGWPRRNLWIARRSIPRNTFQLSSPLMFLSDLKVEKPFHRRTLNPIAKRSKGQGASEIIHPSPSKKGNRLFMWITHDNSFFGGRTRKKKIYSKQYPLVPLFLVVDDLPQNTVLSNSKLSAQKTTS